MYFVYNLFRTLFSWTAEQWIFSYLWLAFVGSCKKLRYLPSEINTHLALLNIWVVLRNFNYDVIYYSSSLCISLEYEGSFILLILVKNKACFISMYESLQIYIIWRVSDSGASYTTIISIRQRWPYSLSLKTQTLMFIRFGLKGVGEVYRILTEQCGKLCFETRLRIKIKVVALL